MRSAMIGLDNRQVRKWKAKAMVLAYALVCSDVGNVARGAASGDSLPGAEYRNADYGYAVRVPEGVRIETSQPPNPNHGFGIKLTPATLLWVDASYTDDASVDQVIASERQVWGKKCQQLSGTATLLGGLPASRVTLKCAGKAPGDSPEIIIVVVALLSQPRNGTIKYEVGLQGPLKEPAAAYTKEMFSKLVKDFYITEEK